MTDNRDIDIEVRVVESPSSENEPSTSMPHFLGSQYPLQLPRSAPPPSAFVDMRPQSVPTGESFHAALGQWQWTHIGGCQLPAVMRHGELYVSVHMVQLRLLSRFPQNPGIPAEQLRKYMMNAHKMSPSEAWVFNAVNAVLLKFENGWHCYTPNDEIVKAHDVLIFYLHVKAHYMVRISEQYGEELMKAGHNFALIATITQLKKAVEIDLENLRVELRTIAPGESLDDDLLPINGVKQDQKISVC